MLVFYGMALLNASKYTLPDIRYLGISEIILGLIGGVFTGYGLLLWAIGFGCCTLFTERLCISNTRGEGHHRPYQ